MKKCLTCHKKLPILLFSRDKTKRDGYMPYCKNCKSVYSKLYNQRDYVKIKAKSRNKDPKVIAYHKEYHLKKKYNISLEEWNNILKKQGNRCKICNILLTFKQIPLDHSHATGKVRGILCNYCNRGLGWFFDNPNVLRRAADYLEGALEVTECVQTTGNA